MFLLVPCISMNWEYHPLQQIGKAAVYHVREAVFLVLFAGKTFEPFAEGNGCLV